MINLVLVYQILQDMNKIYEINVNVELLPI